MKESTLRGAALASKSSSLSTAVQHEASWHLSVYAAILSIFGQTHSGIHMGLLCTNLTTILGLFFLSRMFFGATAAVATVAFTWGIGLSEHDEEIVRVMIRMSHAMGLKVICEGVETQEQLEFLQREDCDLVQGYLFSKPRSVAEITKLYIGELNGTIKIMDMAN